jgi:transcriptional regulator with XRE-family HTH domain
MASRREPEQSALELFAEELRLAREQAGLSRDDLGAQINYSGSLVAMVEGLHRVPQADFAERCDQALGTTGTFARLQKRLRDLQFPASFRPFAAYEERAAELRMFEPALIPGLLQTPEYAKAVLAARPNTTSDEVDDLVAARLARQLVLNRDNPPLLWVLIDEAVLHREWGGPKVMRDQLLHLAEMSHRPNITVEVIPYSAGGHIGLQGAFWIASFRDMAPAVFLETAADGQVSENAATVATVSLRFDSLRGEALPRSASRDLITKVAEEWT